MALGAIFYKILKMAPAEMEKRVCEFSYSRFHKTFLKSSLQMHWIKVRFYEMGDTKKYLVMQNFINIFNLHYPFYAVVK